MICHVTIQTEDLKKSLDFYTWLLGLPIARRFEIPEGEIVFLGSEQTKLELIARRGYKKAGSSEGITVGYKVDSLDAKLTMLDGKGIPHGPVISPNPHARFAYVSDPDGIQIQLFEEK